MLISRIIRKLACSGVRLHSNVMKVERTGPRRIYLTFDDGPHPIYTDQVLCLLGNYDIKATFFLQGNSIEANKEVVTRIVAHGHTLANHTYSHKILPYYNKIERMAEIDRCQALIEQFQDKSIRIFRPPAGLLKIADLCHLVRNGYRVAFWTIDSRDSFNVTAQFIEERLKQLIKGESIVLFHDDASLCLPALENLIPYWLSNGYTFSML